MNFSYGSPSLSKVMKYNIRYVSNTNITSYCFSSVGQTILQYCNYIGRQAICAYNSIVTSTYFIPPWYFSLVVLKLHDCSSHFCVSLTHHSRFHQFQVFLHYNIIVLWKQGIFKHKLNIFNCWLNTYKSRAHNIN